MKKCNKSTLIINELKNHYGFTTNIQFASFLGIAPQTLNSWMDRNSLDYDLIYAKCVNINANWLLTGNGAMLRDSSNTSYLPTSSELGSTLPPITAVHSERDALLSALREAMSAKDKQIEATQRLVEEMGKRLALMENMVQTQTCASGQK
jgi:hypothetical protein